MASTNTTSNIRLNQWAAEDPVLREDFNDDNKKIDDAISGVPIKRIASMTLPVAVNRVEMEISNLDLRDYAAFQIFTDVQCSTDVGLGFGSVSYANNYLRANFSTTVALPAGDGTHVLTWLPNGGYMMNIMMTFSYIDSSGIRVMATGSNVYSVNNVQTGTGIITLTDPSQIKTVRINAISSSATLAVGGRVVVYGYKR